MELRGWKSSTTRLVNIVASLKVRVDQCSLPLDFVQVQHDHTQLTVFVLEKKTPVVALLKCLADYDDRLETAVVKGISIVTSAADDRKDLLELELNDYFKRIDDARNHILEWQQSLQFRRVELEEQLSHLQRCRTQDRSFDRQQDASPDESPRPPGENNRRSRGADFEMENDARSVRSDHSDVDRASECSWGGVHRSRPKQKLPSFQGDLKKFPSYWAGFEAMIHGAKDLPSIDKFFYLRQSLRGEALRIIEEIPVTGANYQKAVDILFRRYDIGDTLTTVIISELQKMKPANSSTKSMRSTLEDIRQRIVTLECHGESFHDASVWRSIILSKFPAEVAQQVIKAERKKGKSASGSGVNQSFLSPQSGVNQSSSQSHTSRSTFSVDDILDQVADYVMLKECIELTTSSVSVSNHGNDSSKDQSSSQKKSKDQKDFSKDKRKDKFKNKSRMKCLCGSSDHRPQECSEFPTVEDRWKEVKNRKCCHLCFDTGHQAKDCNRLGLCPQCKKLHNSALCDTRLETSSKTSSRPPSSSASSASSGSTAAASSKRPNFSHSAVVEELPSPPLPSNAVNQELPLPGIREAEQVILMTARAQIFNEKTGEFDPVDIFFDDGSVSSMIRSSLCESAALESVGQHETRFSGFGESQVKTSGSLAKAKLRSLVFGEEDRVAVLKSVDQLVQELRVAQISKEDAKKIKELRLPVSHVPSPSTRPAILIGQDLRKHFVYEEVPSIRLPSGLLLTKTVFGYAISGRGRLETRKLPVSSKDLEPVHSVVEEYDVCAPIVNQALEEFKMDLKNLYELESIGIRVDKDENESRVIQFMEDYRKTIQISPGQVIAGFPFLDNVSQLKDNLPVAVKQLQHLLKDLRNKPDYMEQYQKTFADYVAQGIIEEVPLEKSQGITTFYMPHHPVVNPEKSTSFRVVFNASSHSRGHLSLNDVIFSGYSLNALIYNVLLMFRGYEHAMIGDIQKAFLQIRLPESHRDATRFVWIRNPRLPATGANLKAFRFCRVPFGINASPSILNQVILKHMENLGTETTKEIAHTIYVDNVLLSGRNKEDLLAKYKESKEAFSRIGMVLRDFLSSSSETNMEFPAADKAKSDNVKVLGVPWTTADDQIHLHILRKNVKKWTTRSVLSQINGAVYDPLGIMSPFLLRMKIFMQDLHRKKKGWKDELSPEEVLDWNAILDEVVGVSVSLPRRVSQLEDVASRTLHVFGDSSQKAYGTVAYVTTRTTSGVVYTRLVTAKMKITPIKTVTIPKLELTAIYAAANLAVTLLSELGLTMDEVNIFSDSMIAIHWVKSLRVLPPFVTDLCLKIQRSFDRVKSFAPFKLHHVPSGENVADIATRGLTKDIATDHVWWTGPRWLNTNKENWPVTDLRLVTAAAISGLEIPPELNAASVTEGKVSFDVEGGIWPVSRIGSLGKLKRVVAYCLRFLQRMSKGKTSLVFAKEPPRTTAISGQEMAVAERFLVLQEQRKVDLDAMVKECRKLNLKTDEFGVLRKFGRLNNSSLSYDQINPIFVPRKSVLASRIISCVHMNNFHRKGDHLASLVRQRFWIPKLKVSCRKVVKDCTLCAQYNRPYKYPSVSDLPAERVERAAPFAYSGVDLFGPLVISESPGKEEKRWVALFTCFTTRMVHLELVKDMSAKSFLLAFQRFIGRRGVPVKLLSDNGSNFVLSWKVIKGGQVDTPMDAELQSFVASHHMKWSFIPPGAPWMGGTWERMVGLVKKPLLLAIGRRKPSEEVLHTLLCGIEATVNSRPLICAESESDMEILRPVDFCQPKLRLCAREPVKEEGVEEDPTYLPAPLDKHKELALKAVKDIEDGLDRFWRRWQTDYLIALRGVHNKKFMDHAESSRSPSVGDVVLLDEDNHSPRHCWPRGRIMELVKSKDESIRSVLVRTTNGKCLHRPVNKLVPLQIADDLLEPAKEPDREQVPLPPKEDALEPQEPLGIDGKEDTGTDEPSRVDAVPSRRQPSRRAKERIDYTENFVVSSSGPSRITRLILPALMLFCLVSSTVAEGGVVRCTKEGISLVIKEIGTAPPLTSELCVNHRECWTVLTSTSDDQLIYIPPRFTVNDYSVQWRIIVNGSQQMELVACPGIPSCELISCTFWPELLGNPHCWPQTAIAATAFWIYVTVTTIVILWTMCCRQRVKTFCSRKLKSAAAGLLRIAEKCCSSKKENRSTEDVESTALLSSSENQRFQSSRFITIVGLAICMLGLLQGVESCQRVHVIESSNTECSEETNSSCTTYKSITASMSELRKDLCIRKKTERQIITEAQLHLQDISLWCQPVVQFYTRNVELRTVSVKRCPLAGSCISSFCDSVSSRTFIPELAEEMKLPGISRCHESCGGYGCRCFLPMSGCMFSRTVAVPIDEYIYEVISCPKWTVKTRVLFEETYFNGTKTVLPLSLAEQMSTPAGKNAHVTVDFVASPPFPLLLSSLFLRRIPLDNSTEHTAESAGIIVPMESQFALHCPTEESAESPVKCFMRNNCQCSPSETAAHCTCQNINITQNMDSMESRLPVTTPDLALRLVNGRPVAFSHRSIAEVTVTSRSQWNLVVSKASTCAVTASEVTGCFNCLAGASSIIACTSESSFVATVSCSDEQEFAIACGPANPSTKIRVYARTTKYNKDCSVSCSRTNITIYGLLTYSSVWTEPTAHDVHGNFVSFLNLPDVSHIVEIAATWWKTTAAVGVLLVIAITITVLVLPAALERYLLSKIISKKD